MKRRRTVRVLNSTWAVWLPALSVLCISFILGVLLGCFLARNISDAENSALISYMEGYLSAARNGNFAAPALLQVLWETFRWPALVFAFSFTAAGLIGIPIVFCIRGFLLSFAVAAFIRVLGGIGAVLAFLLFGVTGVLSFPVLFVLGTQGMAACQALTAKLMGERRKSSIYGKPYFGRCGVCVAILGFCVCLEQTVVPSLMMALAGTF